MEAGGQSDSCSVCGRTILAGESTRAYVTRDGEPRAVCELCRVRAEAAGWIPAELAAAQLPEGERDGGGRGRMRRFFERARETAAAVGGGGTGSATEPEQTPTPAPEPPEAPEPAPEPEPPARPPLRERLQARPAPPRPQRRRGIPQSPNRRIKRAFEAFNETEYPDMVAGLMRSLGPPHVSAFTSAAAPAEVRITVAWELSWYKWEVDLAAEGLAVRELAKGAEVGELDEEDRAWNAHATADGELELGSGTDAAEG